MSDKHTTAIREATMRKLIPVIAVVSAWALTACTHTPDIATSDLPDEVVLSSDLEQFTSTLAEDNRRLREDLDALSDKVSSLTSKASDAEARLDDALGLSYFNNEFLPQQECIEASLDAYIDASNYLAVAALMSSVVIGMEVGMDEYDEQTLLDLERGRVLLEAELAVHRTHLRAVCEPITDRYTLSFYEGALDALETWLDMDSSY